MNENPVLTSAAVVAVVASLINVAVAFGAPVTEDQKQAILASIPAVWVVAAAFVAMVSPKVTSNTQVERELHAQWDLAMQKSSMAAPGTPPAARPTRRQLQMITRD